VRFRAFFRAQAIIQHIQVIRQIAILCIQVWPNFAIHYIQVCTNPTAAAGHAEMSKSHFGSAEWARNEARDTNPYPLLDVYRSRGWARQRNQQCGKTKVTKGSVAEVLARWFFCWRFGREEMNLFRTYPGFRSLGSLHPGLRLWRPAGWTLEAQVIAQKRGANLGLRAVVL
jgi:hypothetical protein